MATKTIRLSGKKKKKKKTQEKQRKEEIAEGKKRKEMLWYQRWGSNPYAISSGGF